MSNGGPIKEHGGVWREHSNPETESKYRAESTRSAKVNHDGHFVRVAGFPPQPAAYSGHFVLSAHGRNQAPSNCTGSMKRAGPAGGRSVRRLRVQRRLVMTAARASELPPLCPRPEEHA